MEDEEEITVQEFADKVRQHLDKYVAGQETNSYRNPETYPPFLRADEWFEGFQEFVLSK